MSKTEILYERYAGINVIEAIPDKRFKTGYRSKQKIATSYTCLPEGINGTSLRVQQLRSTGQGYSKIMAHCDVSMPMQVLEQKI